jgi:nitrogen fixation/metabolism regulation signal transduction histidine kinase
MVVLILSIFFANRLSKPIIALRNVSADVAKGNYASRAQVASSDEIGELAIDMNKMIESLVKKTNTLVQSNILLNTEIDERKRIETKNFELTNELVVASRNAGMVDTATNVLHNVGNVLNSVNTSISVIGEKINLSKMGNLSQLSDLIKTHEHDLGVFVTTDTKGKHLPKYLINLSGTWINEKEVLLHEVSEVHRNIEHIKNIISKQNALSTLIGVVEIVEISKLLDDAITLVQISPAQMKIKILKEYDSKKSIKVDRVKLFQVIVNLLKNSIEALLESNIEDPQLILRIEDEDQSTSVISIADNGVGISSENIKKIFTHGFTTKKTGHGFGLHMSAIAIQELGGALSMKSEGLGKGATFTIKLPYQALKVAGDQNAGYQSNPNLDS